MTKDRMDYPDPLEVEPDSPLANKAEELIEAARAYREAVKLFHPERVRDIMWVGRDDEVVTYSVWEPYNEQIRGLIHDRFRDELVFTQLEADLDDFV